MSLIVHSLQSFPVQIGDLVIYLSGYQISESSTLKESGCANGSNILTGSFPKGIRIKLKGYLRPALAPEAVVCALAANMLQKQTLILGSLSVTDAMLCGYTVTDEQDTPAISLLFYSNQQPSLISATESEEEEEEDDEEGEEEEEEEEETS